MLSTSLIRFAGGLHRFSFRSRGHVISNSNCNSMRIFSSNNKQIKTINNNGDTSGGNEFDAIGFDILSSVNKGNKIVFDGCTISGFDVLNVKLPSRVIENEEEDIKDKCVHFNSSILAFSNSCYLWKVKSANEIKMESLMAVIAYDPPIEMLFIGCDTRVPQPIFNTIQKGLKKYRVIVEQLDLTNAMATFNILNSEDRNVAVALILENENKL